MNTEIYYYVSPQATDNIESTVSNGNHVTHNMTTFIYNANNIQVGSMQSVNNAWYTNTGKNVTTTTTFITPNGVVVCNFFYITMGEYLVGSVTATPTFSSGIYANQNVTVELIGNANGTRQIVISY